MVWVKICGVTRKEDIEGVIDSKADAVGLIVGYPDSPRNVSEEKAIKLAQYARGRINTVMVTHASYLAKSQGLVNELKPWAVQFYGNLGQRDIEMSKTRFIRCITSSPTNLSAKQFRHYSAVLIDSRFRSKNVDGIIDFLEECIKIKNIVRPKPIILAGGLNPSNVREVITKVRPFGVDVSSGVETRPGIKDRAKIIEFVKRAKGLSNEE